MTYRRYGYRTARPTPRVITAKFASSCTCCGAAIKTGDMVEYFPVGTIAGRGTAAVAHIGGLDGTSARCTAELRKSFEARAVDDYAGRGLDDRWEDQGRDICGA
jgi:hypothetical protein